MATAFKSDGPPPGWYIQPIPVNKNIVDIYFTDTLNGWAVTGNTGALDSGYILKTTNGGTNWQLNFATNRSFYGIQFVDSNIGYACGGWDLGKLYKTINGGNNWNLLVSGGLELTDLFFLNKDTGWICDNHITFGAGLQKTTNGGLNWVQQLNNSYNPNKIFFLNKDTGWVASYDRKVYRTNNSGNNWVQLYDFGTVNIFDMFFTSSNTGWVINGVTDGYAYKTINGGLNWTILTDPIFTNSNPSKIYMINSIYGYISTGSKKILKTFNGINWGQQSTAPSGGYGVLNFIDSLHGWSEHFYIGNIDIVATIDGGGPVTRVQNISSEIPKNFKLFQNYPNPFNAKSNIKYQVLKISDIQIKVFDIQGREISMLVNQRQTPGTYEYSFDAGNLSSGIYFYTLFADGKRIDTKKAILIK
jgi:photosystem II stability/assembly factor-like uncharacterized protein